MDKIILDGELSLVTYQDGEAGSVIKEKIPPVIEPLTAKANGSYTATEGVNGYSPVKVDVPPPVIEPLTAEENGVYTAPEGVDGYSPVTVDVPLPVVEPLDVTENGTYTAPEGVDGYSPVTVNVPLPVIEPLTATENGVYTAPEGVDGYSPVTVDVPLPVIEPLTTTENGVYTAPEGVDGYSPVTVDVPLPVVEPLTAKENGVYTVPEGVDGYSPVTVAIPEYEGAYTVEPSTEEQTLATAGKVMENNIVINKAFGIIKFYAAKKVEANAKYNEFGDFKKAQLPDLPTDRDIVMIDFVNNTSNNRAGVYWIQVKSPQKGEVVTGGKRVGGQFGGSYGCDVYAGATINVYVGDYQL